MKYIALLLLSLLAFKGSAQDDTKKRGLFYKVSLAGTLTTNDDYNLGNDEGETFIDFNAFFFNNTLGYQFDERSSIGLNVEYDRYFRQNLNFIPIHLSFRYNLLDFDDKLFIRGGYGRLVKMGKDFEKGNLYKLGIGLQTFDDDYRNSWLIGLDFSRKRFGYHQEQKLSSVSIFLEFMLF